MKKIYTVFMITLLTISSPGLLHAGKSLLKLNKKQTSKDPSNFTVTSSFASGSYDADTKIATMKDVSGNSTSYTVTTTTSNNVKPLQGTSLGRYTDPNYNYNPSGASCSGCPDGYIYLYGTPVAQS